MKISDLDQFRSLKEKDELKNSFYSVLNNMISPVAFTINCHPNHSFKNKDLKSCKERWNKRSTNITDINALWGCLSNQMSQAFTSSSYRNKTNRDVFCIGNVELGNDSGQIHIHGIANNILDLDVRPFRYILKTAIEKASTKVRIVSGKPDVNYFVDRGWVDYMFKSSYYHQLMA